MREGLSERTDLYLLSPRLITRGGEKAEVNEEERETGVRKGEEEGEGVSRETRVKRNNRNRVGGAERVGNSSKNPRRIGGGITACVCGVVGVEESVFNQDRFKSKIVFRKEFSFL